MTQSCLGLGVRLVVSWLFLAIRAPRVGAGLGYVALMPALALIIEVNSVRVSVYSDWPSRLGFLYSRI